MIAPWTYAEWDGITIFQFAYWFDWCAGTPFWAENAPAKARFDVGAFDVEVLPLSEAIIARVTEAAAWFDTALNWDSPADPGPWRREECDRFNAAARALYHAVIQELGPAFQVIYAQAAMQEDPDLDAYLADPQRYRRSISRSPKRYTP